ncbi:hypothetical protein BJ742DRAFT_749452 [Cladochytrium replicatum]|nr:hypothetical protein BJ742DRAFT_749452 [Cladochytrium replicatum]
MVERAEKGTYGPFLSNLLVVRDAGSPGNIKVQEFIKSTLKNLGWAIEDDRFNATTPYGTKPFNNIIATKNPNAMRKLVLAAHFDSKYFANDVFLGACDSAAPIAMILDVAHALNDLMTAAQKRITAPSSSVSLQLVFFDGEEAFVTWTNSDSLYGSRHLAEKWEATYVEPVPVANGVGRQGATSNAVSVLSTIDLFVLLDLLGTADGRRIPNTMAGTSWAWDRLVDIQSRLGKAGLLSNDVSASVAKGSSDLVYFMPGYAAYAGGVQDDHLPFMQRGVPIVHVIPQPFPSVWHEPSDGPDALSEPAIRDLALIFRIFVAEYLGLTAS